MKLSSAIITFQTFDQLYYITLKLNYFKERKKYGKRV